jgi:hypothetical protein
VSDTDDELGIQAFRNLTEAVDRFGITLKTSEDDRKTHTDEQKQAVAQALKASQTALQASQNALQASKTQIRSSLLWTGFGALAVLLVASALAFYFGHSSGWDQGHAAGYTSARDEAAAASWANTPNGQRALALDRLGSLNLVTACSEPGWRIEKQKDRRVCFAGSTPDGKISGWFIP